MTILQLECVLAVCECGRYAEAAERTGIQQTVLKRHLRTLEEEYSVKLFEKGRQGLHLTAQGEALYPHFAYIYREYCEMMERLHEILPAKDSILTFGTMYFSKQYGIVQMVQEFCQTHPRIHVEISEYRAHDLEERLNKGELDACFAYQELLRNNYSAMIPIQEDFLYAVVGRNHPLAEREVVSLSELKDETLVLMRGDHRIYRQLLTFCAEEGFVPHEYALDLRNETIKDWIAGGDVISLFMGAMADDLMDNRLRKIPIERRKRLTLSFAVKKESEECRLFANYVRSRKLWI